MVRALIGTYSGSLQLGTKLVCSGCHNEIPRPRGHKQQKHVFSQCWGWESKIMVRQVCFLLRPLLGSRCCLPMCPHVVCILCMRVCALISYFYLFIC